MQADDRGFHYNGTGQLQENAANLLDLLVFVQQVLVTQEIKESQLAGLGFRLGAGMKWPILRPQLLGGVTGHPESLFVSHVRPASGIAEPALNHW